ncbi:PREDICTED: AFP homolog 2-like isoform X1 [Tarenaya hassleriana]|uniref:AFP homolog 2-like isoform X1 n=1 Tax=Tarenaya hassleriana TaxID=28532 RepID=UPI00053C8EA5|nr:PREDICTED: AFP homolog 2-like isoform X1 [Tarenaya hassleriana]
MEDDNGLELSLGLFCGGSSGKSKGNNTNHKAEGGDRSSKVIDDFKNFLQSSSQRQEEPSAGSQRSDSGKSPQNFFGDLSKAASADAKASTKPFWAEDEMRAEAGNKRKFLFSEISDEKKKKNEKDDGNVDLHEKKTKTSHISITTDEGSTAENEDVAESEVGGTSEAAKEVLRPAADANVVGQRKSGSSAAEEFTIRNPNYSVPFPVHPLNITSSSYPLQAKDSGNAVTSVVQPASSGNLPIMFGYSTGQLPMLDKDGAGILVTHTQPPYPGRGSSTTATGRGEGKQPAGEEGSSTLAEEAKGGMKEVSERMEGGGGGGNKTSLSFDFSAIKPGIAADVKFGGSGSRPNLPWVSTTGSGPHGRTISGVTYRYNTNQIKIVCACHGSHMSPEEFVRHASEEYVNPESSIGLTAASAHS